MKLHYDDFGGHPSTWTRTGEKRASYERENGVTLCRWKLGEVTLEINVPSPLRTNCFLLFPSSFLGLTVHGPPVRRRFFARSLNAVSRKFYTCPRRFTSLSLWNSDRRRSCWILKRRRGDLHLFSWHILIGTEAVEYWTVDESFEELPVSRFLNLSSVKFRCYYHDENDITALLL